MATIESQSGEQEVPKSQPRFFEKSPIKERFDKQRKRLLKKFRNKHTQFASEMTEQKFQDAMAIPEAKVAKIFEENRFKILRERSLGSADVESQIAQATAEAEETLKNYEAMIPENIQGSFTGHDVYELTKAFAAFEKIQDPAIKTTFDKLAQDPKENLIPEEYQRIIQLWNPAELNLQKVSAKESYDTSVVGLLLEMMEPHQRVKLVQEFMNSPKKNDTPAVLHALLATGLLEYPEGQKLHELMQKNSIFIPPGSFRTPKEYQQLQDQTKTAVQTEVEANFMGQFSKNIMDRIVGKTGLGLIGTFAAGSTLLLNLILHKGKIHEMGLYGNAALAGLVAGIESVSGTYKQGNRTGFFDKFGFGHGAVSEFLQKKKPDKDMQENVERQFFDSFHALPEGIQEYLSNGGIKTAAQVRKKKLDTFKGNAALISVNDLLEFELAKSSPAVMQVERLTAFRSTSKQQLKEINRYLNITAESANALKINTGDHLTRKLHDIETAKN